MADRITLSFGADIREVERATDDMADGLDDTARKLEDVGKAGEDAGDAAAGGLDDLGESADQAKTKGGDLTDSLTDGLLGVAGVAGGVAGAVNQGLGLAVDFVKGKIDEQIKAAEELHDNLVGAYRDAAAEGQIYLDQAQIIASAQDIIFDSGRLAAAREDAAAIGVDVNTYIRSQAGDYEALKVVIAAAADAEADRRAEGTDGSKSSQADALQEIQNLERIQTSNEKLLELHQDNQVAAGVAIDIQAELGQQERDRIAKTAAADQARYDGIARNVAALKDQKVVIPVDFDTASAQRSIDRFVADQRARRIPIVADVVDRYGRSIP